MSKLLAQNYVEKVAASKLKPHPENPRVGDRKAIALSIQAHGFYGSLLVQKSTCHILIGNNRFEAGKGEGMKHFPVMWVDVDDQEAKRILLNDNQVNDVAGYDHEALTLLLNSIQSEAGTLDGTGYTQESLDRIVKQAGDAVLAATEKPPLAETPAKSFEKCEKCGQPLNPPKHKRRFFGRKPRRAA